MKASKVTAFQVNHDIKDGSRYHGFYVSNKRTGAGHTFVYTDSEGARKILAGSASPERIHFIETS